MIDLRKKWFNVMCTTICIFALGACGKANDSKQVEHGDLQEYSEDESGYEESIETEEMLPDILKTENLNRTSMTNWQAAYIQYIKDSGEGTYYRYALAYIDEDDIPELIQYGVSFADGGTISTYSDGQVSTEWIYNQASGASYYLDRGNVFYNCGGHMGLYYDTLYQIVDGEVVVLHAGCWEALDISYEQYKYSWDNVSVDENAYNTNLEACIDKSAAVRIEYEQMVIADEILKQILAVQ